MHVIHDVHGEAVQRTELPQQIGIPRTATSEAEIDADEHGDHVQRIDEDRADELLRFEEASARSKVSSSVASRSRSASSSSLRSVLTTFSGQISGRSTSSGFRSKVTATALASAAAASARIRSITAR
ncbi:hypothetical protein GCM10025863_12200 [Microbacterium suwonense]|uniref:Uncharacterized protein n=1 Tax=Microbacterium suwonense TaxID=683047 RepID=A0ABM8FSE3_9MICO|nr:hypothetical protein GCM10025863_12200 [Microbacterium suwonense]